MTEVTRPSKDELVRQAVALAREYESYPLMPRIFLSEEEIKRKAITLARKYDDWILSQCQK